ncbi:MAG: metallophosphoesterase [Proteobacteria bacterium]|nr:metallophosphoesterase [Pseudomonadota bacterium]
MNLLKRPSDEIASPRIPDGQRLYAVGDIHGRDDLIATLHARIRDDAASAGDLENWIIYLGDYIDRGEGTYRVIRSIIKDPLPNFQKNYLKGNHEDLMLDFLSGGWDINRWLSVGGSSTLSSYGVEETLWMHEFDVQRVEELRIELTQAIPMAHLTFLRNLRLTHRSGDYFFVHAGVRPGTKLERQDGQDLMWIRDEFTRSRAHHGAVIVHGHSIVKDVDFAGNRIAVDTGAWRTDRLSCLVLEGASQRVLHT